MNEDWRLRVDDWGWGLMNDYDDADDDHDEDDDDDHDDDRGEDDDKDEDDDDCDDVLRGYLGQRTMRKKDLL